MSGALKPSLSNASHLPGASVLRFFTSTAPLRESYWLLVTMYVSPPRVPIGFRDSLLVTMTSLFTEKAGILSFSEFFH